MFAVNVFKSAQFLKGECEIIHSLWFTEKKRKKKHLSSFAETVADFPLPRMKVISCVL
jgi:hypothetical protein